MRDVHIMDIAMNLARIGNWAADDFDGKEKRIELSLEQTNRYLLDIDLNFYSDDTKKALTRFIQVFNTLRAQTPTNSSGRLLWAEEILTWSNILTHKARIRD